jgi:hypothetical protein
MGVKVGDRTTMSRICWWLVGILCRLLSPDERDAVRGDLTESGSSGAAAVLDVVDWPSAGRARCGSTGARGWRSWES